MPYPINYGTIPQTVLAREKGGDGDPVDIITLVVPGQPRGAINQVKIIGDLLLLERGEMDAKIVATLPGGPSQDVNDLQRSS